MNEGERQMGYGYFEIVPTKTYGSENHAKRAVLKAGLDDLRFFIMKSDDDRYFPVFVGATRALARGVHFKFNVVG
jgi:hypothetical protein